MRKAIPYAFVTGLAGALCWFPGACVWVLPFFLVPGRSYLYLHREFKPSRVFILALIMQIFGCAIGFYWISSVLTNMFGMPAWGGILGLLLFAAIGQIHLSLAAFAWATLLQRFPLNLWASYVLFGALIFLGELIYPLLFPFNFGYPWLWSGSSIAQLASVVGFSGLSLFTYWINGLMTMSWVKFKERSYKSAFIFLTAGLFSLLSAQLLGNHLKSRWDTFDKNAKIGFAQASLAGHNRMESVYGARYREYELNRYIQLTNQALSENKTPDFFIWPENVLLLRANTDDPIGLKIRKQVQLWKFPLLAGLQSSVDPKVKSEVEYGSVVTFGMNGEIEHIYNKVKLVPLGEFIPWTDFLPAMKMFDLGSAPMISGESIEGGVSTVSGIKIGTNVCYESLDPIFAKVFVDNGAQLIVNISSDIWFGQTLEPYQHFYLSMARAIEARRPIIRIATTGISGYALANGDIHILAKSYESGSGIFDVQYKNNPEQSIFNRYGQWVTAVLLILSFSPLLAKFWSIGLLNSKIRNLWRKNRQP